MILHVDPFIVVGINVRGLRKDSLLKYYVLVLTGPQENHDVLTTDDNHQGLLTCML